MTGPIAVNSDAVVSRASALRSSISDNNHAAQTFSGRAGDALDDTDGITADNIRRYNEAVVESVRLATAIADDISTFFTTAVERLDLLDSMRAAATRVTGAL